MTASTQARLIEVMRITGPITVRKLALLVYGVDTRQKKKLMAYRIGNACRLKLVEFAGFADRPGRQAGKFPAQWKVKS